MKARSGLQGYQGSDRQYGGQTEYTQLNKQIEKRLWAGQHLTCRNTGGGKGKREKREAILRESGYR